MKKILLCGMLLGLLSTMSFAQRGRVMGGAGPTARTPNARMSPNATNVGHDGIAPNATANTQTRVHPNATTGNTPNTVGPNASTGNRATAVGPDAATGRTATTVSPNANDTPDRVITPDATPMGDRTVVGPDQQ